MIKISGSYPILDGEIFTSHVETEPEQQQNMKLLNELKIIA